MSSLPAPDTPSGSEDERRRAEQTPLPQRTSPPLRRVFAGCRSCLSRQVTLVKGDAEVELRDSSIFSSKLAPKTPFDGAFWHV